MTNDFYIPKTVSEVRDVLSKRKLYFLVPFFLVLAATRIVFPFLPKLYLASATLLVEDESFANPAMRDREAMMSQPKADGQLRVLSVQIMSFSSLSGVLKEMGELQEGADPQALENKVAGLRKRLLVKMTNDGVIQVSYQDRRAHFAQRMANAIAETLVKFNEREKQEKLRNAIDFVGAQLRLYSEKLQTSEASSYASKLDADLAEARNRRQMLADQLAQSEKTVVQQVTREQNPAVADMRRELLRSQNLLKQLLLESKGDNPMVRDYKDRIESLKKKIEFEEESRAGGDTANVVSAESQQVRRELKELDLRIANLQDTRKDLALGKNLPRKMSAEELTALERDKKMNEDMYQALRSRLENAQMSRQMDALGQSRRLKIIDPARLPQFPVTPNPGMIYALGVVLAFVLGTAGVAAREMCDPTFRNARDAAEYFEREPLAVFDGGPSAREGSGAPSSISPEVVVHHAPQSAAAEHYRLLRSTLLSAQDGGPVKTILVAGVREGEGKTALSVNLAVSLARELSKRVLLVDCDLRRGEAAPLLGLPPEGGLSEWLSGPASGAPPIRETAVKGLSVLTSGKPAEGPSRFFALEGMRRAMEKARGDYDFIVLNAPSAAGSADVPVLLDHADGVLLVFKTGSTPRAAARGAVGTAEASPRARFLGYALIKGGRIS